MKWLSLAVILAVCAVTGPLLALLTLAGFLLAAAFAVLLAFAGAVFFAARRFRSNPA